MSISLVNHPLVIGIPKPDNYFDYVHQRFLVGGLPVDRWEQHIQECARVCASDGWVEIIESDAQIIDGGPACQQFSTWLADGFKTRGIDMNVVHNLDELMHKAGLINVTKQTITAPIGPWGGKAGELFAQDYKLISNAIQPLIASVFNVPKEEIENNCALMVEEFKSHRTYIYIHVYLGQKQ
jgi:ubiquinone/menaquinone biosynthesis C-methylase UbiE